MRLCDTVRCSTIHCRYANNSNYKNDTMIRKEAYSHQAVMDELRRIIEDSEVTVVIVLLIEIVPMIRTSLHMLPWPPGP